MGISSILRILIWNATVMQLHWSILLFVLAYLCTVLNRQICLSLSRWYIFKLHTLLSRKGGLVWQFYYSFCQRQLADETISFHVPVNSHFELYICITQAFQKMLSHSFACSVQQTATQLDGTHCNLRVGLGLHQLYKLRAKCLLGEEQRSGKDKISDTSIFISARQVVSG